MTFSSIQWTRAALFAAACATILAVPVTTQGDKPFPKPSEEDAYPNEDIFAIERLCAPPQHFFWEGLTQEFAPTHGLNGHVWDIVATDETSPLGSSLFACGDFTRADGLLVNHIARWDGNAWGALTGGGSGERGLNDVCHSLAVGPDGLLYAGGAFTEAAGGVSALGVARWGGLGLGWSRLGNTTIHGVGGGVVYDLLFYHDSNITPQLSQFPDGSVLVIGGSFTTIAGPGGSTPSRRITSFNGSVYSIEFPTYVDDRAPGGGIFNVEHVGKMIEYDDGRGPALYIGGHFERLGGVIVNNIGRWTPANIEPLGTGVGADPSFPNPSENASFDGAIADMTVSGPNLYAAGFFQGAGGFTVPGVAFWGRTNSGLSWIPIGGPTVDTRNEGVVDANVGAGSAVYLLGFFIEIELAGQIRHASHIAARTPHGVWEDIGGLWPEHDPEADEPETTPHGMVGSVWDDGESQCLYVGGRFDKAGNVDALNIARYCCESWAIKEGFEEAFEIGGALALKEFTFKDEGDGLPESIECAGDEVLLQPGIELEACGFHIVVGTEGDDQIDLSDSPLPALVFGGPGDDELMGSAHDDLVFGANGDDVLHGGPGGGDMVWGGRGDDTLEGDDGQDSMLGGPGEDALCGGDGHDIVDAGSGRDTVCAGSEEDEVRGVPDDAAPSVCGDGITEGTEVCDDGVNGGGEEECLPGCTGFQSCGDGVTDGTEQCDDGVNDEGTGPLGCLAGCLSSPSITPTSGPIGTVITIVDPAGSMLDGDLVRFASPAAPLPPDITDTQVNIEGTELTAIVPDGLEPVPYEVTVHHAAADDPLFAPLSFELTLGPRPVCGNGIREGSEVCDDGINDGDEGECVGCFIIQTCGDGIVVGGESCDDGFNDGDEGGCLPGCSIIQNCGDGVTEGTEECDDRVNDGTGPLGCLAGCLSPP